MMKTIYTLLFTLIFTLPLFAASTEKTTTLAEGQQYLASQQTAFEENKGQVTGEDGPKVKYTYQAGGLSVFLMSTGIAYQFNKTHYPEGYKHLDKFASQEEQEEMDKLAEDIRLETYRMNVTLVGANPNAKITTEGKSKDYIQYYNHNALDVHSFSKVTYHDVYPNIDWVIYKKGETIKYDFVVHPGGDPAQIKLETTHAENIELDDEGNLILTTSMGTITEKKPVSFQSDNEINTVFELNKNVLTFIVEDHNKTEDLVIDPLLGWATYYGGSSDDQGESCVVDDSGNVYLSGFSSSSTSIASGGHQNIRGSAFGFLAKFNDVGIRQWATYYGIGATACAVDDVGNVYLAGYTWLTTGTSMGGHQNSLGGLTDAFLVKFNSNGIRLWGTYYGGSSEDRAYSCSVDYLGNVFLTGFTESTSNISSNGFQNAIGGDKDMFVVKFNALGVRLWATYFGGSSEDISYSCALDTSGNVYLAGYTRSTSGIASSGFQNSHGGVFQYDAFLVKFNSSGSRLWATYYGGTGNDYGYGCAVDALNNVYLSGHTLSSTGIASNGYQVTYAGGADAFLVKFSSSGTRLWSTYYGGSSTEENFGCAVDPSNNVYLTGSTKSSSNIAYGGFQNTYGGDNFYFGDAFLVKFNALGVRKWATYFGGIGGERSVSCAVDVVGNVCFSGFTTSISGISSNGHQNTYGGGGYDAFLVKILCKDSVVDIQSACDSYTWINGVTYTANNTTATHILTNSSGCDSVIALNLSINSNTGTDVISACDNYTWTDGITYTSSNNTAKDTLVNVNGCDSVVTLNLTISYSNTAVDVQNACGFYTWIDGTTYTVSNNSATYILTNVAGCDSIVNLNLTINNSTTGIDTQTACNSYTWIDGVTYTASNNAAIDTITNVNGCDSIVTLNLIINQHNTGIDAKTACDSYTSVSGNTWNTSGVYYDTLTNLNGCDSIVTLNLTINNSITVVDTQVSCGSYTWINGVTYTSSNNTVTDTLTNSNGCDSIVSLNLTINNSSTGIDTQIACESYTWIDGITYNISNNTATDTITNVNGCDSIVTLNLTINNSTTGIDTQVACGSYIWIDGITYSSSNNTATDTLTNVNGCDSIVTLNLTVNFPSVGTDTQTVCGSYTSVSGKTWTSSGVYSDTLTNATGCDSIVTLNLTILPTSATNSTVSTCGSYSLVTNGVTYYTSGTYKDTLTNTGGCDSIVTLNLTINPIYSLTETFTACDSFTWSDGNVYTTSNTTAVQNLLSVNGCDSIVTLNLTILPTSATNSTVSTCGSYAWTTNGVTYYTSGTYKDTLTNMGGCDSVVTLNLTILPTSATNSTVSMCGSYSWATNGVTYYNSGTYKDTLTNTGGCDSIVTLNLTINPIYSLTETFTACDSFTWSDGNVYTTSNNTAVQNVLSVNGCDSVVGLDLTINNSYVMTDQITSCGSYTWIDGNTYVNNNNIASVTFTSAGGCDSTFTLDLTVTNIDTSLATNVNTLSSNQSGASYQWLDCSVGFTVIPNETNFSYTATVSGSYAVEITMNGCTDTSSCVVLTNVGIAEPSFGSAFKIYPNPTSGKVSVNLGKTYQNVTVTVLNSIGQVVSTPIKKQNTDLVEFEITGERAVYFIQIKTENESGLWKVIKD